ncbi:CoA transferase [Pseudonocardia sp. UM4_GMWB1]|uniref:CoA transferase n=1 Tax=Pseudonocardia sp. UM4_GMWB1 TaxID=2212989 RepID=UPI00307F8AA1
MFGTADGAISVGAGSPPTQERLATIAGLPVALLGTDPDTVRIRLTALFATRTSAEWIAELRAAAIPCGEVRALDEVLSDPHVEAEGLVADVEHPAIGRYRGLGSPIRFGDTPSDPTRPSPAFAAPHHRRARRARLHPRRGRGPAALRRRGGRAPFRCLSRHRRRHRSFEEEHRMIFAPTVLTETEERLRLEVRES